MTTNSSPNKSSEIYTKLPFISPSLSLQNTKFFLESYKTSKNISLFAEKFLNECPLYTRESQIPDSFYKLHKPFDRNSVFYIAHGPYGTSRRNASYTYNNMNRNYYPKYPLILSSSCDLIARLNKKNKDRKEEHKSGETIEEGEKDFMMHDVTNKVWSMKLLKDNSICHYGPYSSKVVYQFLKNYYVPLDQQEQNKMNLLITDLMCDIYYQPDSLYQMLQDAYTKN